MIRFVFSFLSLGFISFASQGVAAPVSSQPYVWKNVRMGGGGFVTGLVYHPSEKGVLYARTDVGGAYRWDQGTEAWTALTDFLGADDVNLTGIESVAVDPSDPNRLYLAAGTYTHPRSANGAMLLSTDRGETFQRVSLPFKLGANEAGRGDGERLAVDPHQSSTLYFGSRAAGLWRSRDYGQSWNAVPSFPAIAVSDQTSTTGRWKQPVGIVFVLFDDQSGKSGEPTPVIFCGLSMREGGLYCSRDAGETWESVPGQPTGVRPQRGVLTSERWLYLTFGDEPAPNSMATGSVWRFHLDRGDWEEITPAHPTSEEKFGYGGIAVDPSHPSTLIVATFSHWKPPGDEIFRTQDGGKTWKPLLLHARWDHGKAPWTKDARPHWMADLKIDPHNPDRAWFTTGYGVWETQNLTAADQGQPVGWQFSNDGLEETVPLGLISPPAGTHLLSAVGDLDGYRHEDLTRSPLQFTAPPRYSNSESITFAGKKPEVLARTGTIRNRELGGVAAAYSTDGGRSWTAFPTAPAPTASAGTIAVSSDASVFIWSPRGGFAARTVDRGATWAACADLPANARVVADAVDPLLCFALDGANGQVWKSEDAGAHFAIAYENLPKPPPAPGGFGGGPRGSGTLHPAPDAAGDLWIGFREDGLYQVDATTKTFRPIPGVQRVYSLGFGRAKPGRTNSALYLAGTVEGVNGLFRSDDAGKSWVRINDDRHQFGWISHVTGDPRIYGRVYFGTGGRGIFYGDPQP